MAGKRSKKRTFQIVFQPSNRTGNVQEGKTVLEAARELGVEIESLCGGLRSCGKCKIRLIEGNLSPFTKEEGELIREVERTGGYRLACAAEVEGDVLIYIPKESRREEQVARKEVSGRAVELKPAVTLHFIELHPPSLYDPLGDWDRLKKGLSERYPLHDLKIDYQALLRLPSVLRQGNWKVTVAVWMNQEVIALKRGRVDDVYGLAIDIGTTTVAGYLCSLTSGKVIATESVTNPQLAYGEDVMTRITYAIMDREGLQDLHRRIIDGLNGLILSVTDQANVSPDDLLELSVVGNTAMHHLFLAMDPQYLGVSPFPPVLHRSLTICARELGLKVNHSAKVFLPPIEAGFVGADNVGVLISEEPYKRDEMSLIIDVGTNGELIMGNRERLLSASCATGPAFEGAHIKFGMRAAQGAIERVEIDPKTFDVKFKVVGKEGWSNEMAEPEAKGICGSGIIDAVAELYRAGIIDKTGTFKNGIRSPRLRNSNGKAEFVIAWKEETSIGAEITVTQQDVRNVQLGKAALYAGAKLLMRKLGLNKLDRILLAGAFGSYIDPTRALILGMFPDCDLDHIEAVGNAAGDGARIMLLNRDKRIEAEEIAKRVEYVELTIEKDFQKEFIEAMHIPHGRDPFPHLKGIVRDEILNQ